MPTLERTVRFCINPGDAGPSPAPNAFAGSPSMRGLGRYYEITVRCAGEVNPLTGYLLDIKTIDESVRAHAVPLIARACRESPGADPASLMPSLFAALSRPLAALLHAVRWRLTPYYSVEMASSDTSTVLLRQRFDFSASHRLHVPSMSDEENRRAFGKCNSPSGHGHNYRLEPAVAVRLTPDGPAFTLADLERIANETVIRRFDHKNLNTDTTEFADGRGVNPTVENIARVCYDLLAPAIAHASGGRAELRAVTIWETDRTASTYPDFPGAPRAG